MAQLVGCANMDGDGPANLVGGIQDKADPIWGPIPSSSAVPVELRLDAEDPASVGLQLFEEGHRISTSARATQTQ